MIGRFSVLSKSPWIPSIRREHALAREAILTGFAVHFVEVPEDIRSAAQTPLKWISELRGVPEFVDGVEVTYRSTFIPGHKNEIARKVDVGLLHRILQAQDAEMPVISYLPWQWSASSKSVKRVFDCTDPWPRLYPHRESAIRRQMQQIGQEADEIIVVSSELAEYFPERDINVIPNGVDEALLSKLPVVPPGNSVMLYLGTLSERIDFELLSRVLLDSPTWSLDLVGPCAFRGFGGEPSDELREFLRRFEGRVTLHNSVSRIDAQKFIDRSDILIAPTFREFSVGQSSMKTFDAAARGRQVLSRSGLTAGTSTSPAQIFSDDADGWSHVLSEYVLDSETMLAIRSWAELQTWSVRFKDWISLVVPK